MSLHKSGGASEAVKTVPVSFPTCRCGRAFEDHEMPAAGVSWDICSFPCPASGCFEYDGVYD
jgi:hypothetical protein